MLGKSEILSQIWSFAINLYFHYEKVKSLTILDYQITLLIMITCTKCIKKLPNRALEGYQRVKGCISSDLEDVDCGPQLLHSQCHRALFNQRLLNTS